MVAGVADRRRWLRYRGWFIVHPWEIAITAAPKVASRSLLFSIAHHFRPELGYDEIPTNQWDGHGARFGFARIRTADTHLIPDSYQRVGVVREPVERFASLWRCQIRDGLGGIRSDRRFRHIRTPEELITLIEQRPRANFHWLKQYWLLDDAETVVRLEDLGCWWMDRFGPDGPRLYHENATDGETPMTDDIADQVRKFYHRDGQIYEEATR